MLITIEYILFGITVISVLVGMWNAWQHTITGKILAELQLNLKREFNGRYVNVDSFGDAKQRIARLEAQYDSEKE
jgi:hypothetical protein